jgi:hypothetical protein
MEQHSCITTGWLSKDWSAGYSQFFEADNIPGIAQEAARQSRSPSDIDPNGVGMNAELVQYPGHEQPVAHRSLGRPHIDTDAVAGLGLVKPMRLIGEQ